MARKLPWKRKSESSPSSATRNSAVQSPRLPVARQDENRDILRTPVSRRHVRRVLDSDPIRSPSTSPPPERPQEEFMVPGPLNDDKFRMVDDEFLHIAQRFTAHLHRAEYDRLKALAKAQNAATIREIERPIVPDAAPTARARQRSESAQRAMKQRKALEAEGGDDGDGDGRRAKGEEQRSLWAAPGLRGLMEAPKREGRTIMPAASASSSSSSRTRAAAGFSSKSSPQQDRQSRAPSPPLPPLVSSSKRIKLDSPANSRSTTTSSRTTTQHHRTSTSNPQATSSLATEVPRGISRTERPQVKSSNQRPSVHGVDDDLDDDPFGLHERMMSRKKSREHFKRPGVKREVKDESNTIDLSSIPSFL
ncbi:hypothetical protein TrVFT333_001589 [Trichoderma virens FT-333]|nr:hypothetical protein TrVFT333_001589 [Trichoderma virens FT-333]